MAFVCSMYGLVAQQDSSVCPGQGFEGCSFPPLSLTDGFRNREAFKERCQKQREDLIWWEHLQILERHLLGLGVVIKMNLCQFTRFADMFFNCCLRSSNCCLPLSISNMILINLVVTSELREVGLWKHYLKHYEYLMGLSFTIFQIISWY